MIDSRDDPGSTTTAPAVRAHQTSFIAQVNKRDPHGFFVHNQGYNFKL